MKDGGGGVDMDMDMDMDMDTIREKMSVKKTNVLLLVFFLLTVFASIVCFPLDRVVRAMDLVRCVEQGKEEHIEVNERQAHPPPAPSLPLHTQWSFSVPGAGRLVLQHHQKGGYRTIYPVVDVLVSRGEVGGGSLLSWSSKLSLFLCSGL